ncbi:DUF4286 family protein [Actinomadura mexicana]|uniref:EthD domain-containing protein n=1 Tax=Actinomadura mexicana TaxID=134959 RepID=A0A238XFS7_9ACTN|nr:DUF4286 family protein [Actinomadura mexicana]SNR57174.1 hypothetical protein SAMN06265355_104250 [Actinomadura mexicana]
MANHVFVVLTQPADGMTAEFNRWYDTVHIPDVLKIPDFVAVQRFRFVPQRSGDEPLRPYLALYETETEDIRETHARLAAVAGTDRMPFDPSIDQAKSVAWYYRATMDRRTSETVHWPLEHRRVLLEFTTPKEGCDDEFDAWYVTERIPGMLAVEGIASARRFEFIAPRPDLRPLRPHLALYEADTDDVPGTQRRTESIRPSAAVTSSPAIDPSQVISWFYEPIGERVES